MLNISCLFFQQEIINGLFETNQNGLWQHKHCLVMLPRKSGKSELLSAIALWALIASGEWAPEVYCVAASKDQARIVLDNIKAMIELEPELKEEVKELEEFDSMRSMDEFNKLVED